MLTKDIKKKILESIINFETDSDVEDFAQENGISADDVASVILNNNYQYGSCHGCKFIVNRAHSLGEFGECRDCSRIHKVEDRYVPDLRFAD